MGREFVVEEITIELVVNCDRRICTFLDTDKIMALLGDEGPLGDFLVSLVVVPALRSVPGVH